VLIDISASTTTNGMTARMNRAGRGERLPGLWLVDNQGIPSDDPCVMLGDPPGAILPLGGVEQGYKGFALGLLVEALTSGLTGYGRADGEKRWGASVFMQLLDNHRLRRARTLRARNGLVRAGMPHGTGEARRSASALAGRAGLGLAQAAVGCRHRASPGNHAGAERVCASMDRAPAGPVGVGFVARLQTFFGFAGPSALSSALLFVAAVLTYTWRRKRRLDKAVAKRR